ncbi:hypothetical protein D3C78_658850 [compost metagenome]
MQGVAEQVALERLHRFGKAQPLAGATARAFLERWQAQGIALGNVAQFPHIAGPVMGHQARQGLAVQCRHVPVEAQRRLLQEVFEQLQDIFTALAQWRQLQGYHVEAVVQVAAELPTLAELVEVGLGCGDHPAVHRNALVRAQALQGALLQYPQQFDLQVDRHALDFIEEQGTAIGVLDLADTAFACAGESIGLVAKDFALEQVFRQTAAIERHKRLVLAPAEIVQATGDQLFAGTGLAFDQHVGRGVGNVGDQLTQLLHGARAADDAAFQAALFCQLAAQGQHFAR